MKVGLLTGTNSEPDVKTETQSVTTTGGISVVLTSAIPQLKIGDVIEIENGTAQEAWITRLTTPVTGVLIWTNDNTLNTYCKITDHTDQTPNLNYRGINISVAFTATVPSFTDTANPSGVGFFSYFDSGYERVVRKLDVVNFGAVHDLSKSNGYRKIKLTKVWRVIVTEISIDQLTLSVRKFDDSPVIPDNTYSAINVYKTSQTLEYGVIGNVNSLGFSQLVDIDSTGSVDNYAVGNASVVKISAGITAITSIQAPSNGSQILYLHNNSGGPIDLRDTTYGAGQVLNRIITGTGTTVVLPDQVSCTLLYDTDSSRWRLLGIVNTAPSSGITVGTTPVIAGTAGRVLFEDAGNTVSESADLTFDTAQQELTAYRAIFGNRLTVNGRILLADSGAATFSSPAAALGLNSVPVQPFNQNGAHIRGIAADATDIQGRTVTIFNNYDTKLEHASSFAAAADRIYLPAGLDFILPAGEMLTLIYKTVNAVPGWYVLNYSPTSAFSPAGDFTFESDIVSAISLGTTDIQVPLNRVFYVERIWLKVFYMENTVSTEPFISLGTDSLPTLFMNNVQTTGLTALHNRDVLDLSMGSATKVPYQNPTKFRVTVDTAATGPSLILHLKMYVKGTIVKI